ETRGPLGAPVDVDRPVTAAPAPFVSEDSVYGYIIGLLDSAQTNLKAANTAGTPFPFSMPAGFFTFTDPGEFNEVNRAIAAKAEVFRATALNGCNGTPANCYTAAETDLAASFYQPGDSTYFKYGASFDFSTDGGDQVNGLSDPLNSSTYYALPDFLVDADTQVGGAKDLRALSKIVPAQDTQVLGGIPINGQLKFTVYFTGGAVDLNHSIPIIRDEELALLDAEAQIGLNNLAAANTILNLVRKASGNLPPDTLTGGSPKAAYIAELLQPPLLTDVGAGHAVGGCPAVWPPGHHSHGHSQRQRARRCGAAGDAHPGQRVQRPGPRVGVRALGQRLGRWAAM